jgi:hypothetical protein
MPSFAKMSSWLLPFRRQGHQTKGGGGGGGLSLDLNRSGSSLSNESAHSKTSDKECRKVNIDAITEVPVELYLDMVEAGKKARARGQHHKVRQSCPDAQRASGHRSTSSLVSSEALEQQREAAKVTM